MGCAYFAILAIKRNDPRNWLWFGLVAGLGMEEKYSIALFGFGIVVGLLLTEQRRVFANKWIWLGGAAAFLIFLPNLSVEHSLPLAVRRIDAEHQSGRSRCCSAAVAVFLPADAAGPSSYRAHLDHWPDCAFLLATTEDLPGAGLELPGLLHRLLRSSRQELLPCSDLSHAPGGGSGDHRERHRPTAPDLDETGNCGAAAGWRYAHSPRQLCRFFLRTGSLLT